MNLGNFQLEEKRYLDSLASFKEAHKLTADLFDVNLTLEMENQIKKLEAIIQEDRRLIEELSKVH